MAVILFKKGGYKIFDENSFQHELNNGWFLTNEEAEKAWAEDAKAEAEKSKDDKPKGDKDDKDAIIKKLRARKAELLAEQNKE